METCKNCGIPMVGAFCHGCGQKADTHRLDWHWLGHELQHSVFHVDKGILYTLKELFLRPGRHFPPLSLILVLAAVYSVLYAFFKPDMSAVQLNPEGQKAMELMSELMTSKYALFELMLLPLVSFWSWLLMKKFGHNFVEHVIINAFLGGQRILLNVLFLPLNKFGMTLSFLASGLLFVAYFGFFIFGYVQLYEHKNTTSVVLRSISAYVLFWIVAMLIMIVGVAAFQLATHA
jgi:hypothetical protein